jgi:hypothetical protein
VRDLGEARASRRARIHAIPGPARGAWSSVPAFPHRAQKRSRQLRRGRRATPPARPRRATWARRSFRPFAHHAESVQEERSRSAIECGKLGAAETRDAGARRSRARRARRRATEGAGAEQGHGSRVPDRAGPPETGTPPLDVGAMRSCERPPAGSRGGTRFAGLIPRTAQRRILLVVAGARRSSSRGRGGRRRGDIGAHPRDRCASAAPLRRRPGRGVGNKSLCC